ncbi:MAG: DUF4825 domain-containing protein [Clostridia bacterium]|nr:DUF4825 domain-containing protein [Clostridia bacterium]
MKNDLSCQVVRDLLPIYIDGLTSDETNAVLENHLESCPECRSILEAMQSGESADPDGSDTEKDVKEIDYLKKNRKIFKNSVIAAVIAALVLSCGFFGYRKYGVERPVPYSMLNFEEIKVEGGKFSYKGSLADTNLGVTSCCYSEANGVLMLEIGCSGKLPSRDCTFDGAFESPNPIKSVWYGSYCLWDSGEAISEGAAKLFASKHPYAGDMPANVKTAEALGISRVLGPYVNQLSTSEEPYGWDINLVNEFTSDDAVTRQFYMVYFGTMLIGSVDNLSYVNFNYIEDGVSTFVYVDEEVASRYTEGLPVKMVCSTAKGMQGLIRSFWFESNASSQMIPVGDGLGAVIPF